MVLVLEMYFYPICGLSRKAKPGMKMSYNYFSKTNNCIYPIKISPNKIEPRFYGFDGPRNKNRASITLLELNRASILFSSVKIVSRLVLPCANEWMKPFVGLLFYLSILAVSHCCLFLESPTYLCSCAVVLYTVPPPNLVTVTLHYFLSQPLN